MLRIIREAEYVLYKVPYLFQVQQEKDKKETNSRGRRYVPTYLKVGKRNEFYRVYTKSQVNNIGRPNNTLQKKRKKIKTKYDR